MSQGLFINRHPTGLVRERRVLDHIWGTHGRNNMQKRVIGVNSRTIGLLESRLPIRVVDSDKIVAISSKIYGSGGNCEQVSKLI